MRPDGDLVAGLTAAVIVILAIIFVLTFNAANDRSSQLEFSKQCHDQGKEVRYRETGRAIYSECF